MVTMAVLMTGVAWTESAKPPVQKLPIVPVHRIALMGRAPNQLSAFAGRIAWATEFARMGNARIRVSAPDAPGNWNVSLRWVPTRVYAPRSLPVVGTSNVPVNDIALMVCAPIPAWMPPIAKERYDARTVDAWNPNAVLTTDNVWMDVSAAIFIVRIIVMPNDRAVERSSAREACA